MLHVLLKNMVSWNCSDATNCLLFHPAQLNQHCQHCPDFQFYVPLFQLDSRNPLLQQPTPENLAPGGVILPAPIKTFESVGKGHPVSLSLYRLPSLLQLLHVDTFCLVLCGLINNYFHFSSCPKVSGFYQIVPVNTFGPCPQWRPEVLGATRPYMTAAFSSFQSMAQKDSLPFPASRFPLGKRKSHFYSFSPEFGSQPSLLTDQETGRMLDLSISTSPYKATCTKCDLKIINDYNIQNCFCTTCEEK